MIYKEYNVYMSVQGYTLKQIEAMPNGAAKDAIMTAFELEHCPTLDELIPYEYIRIRGEFNMVTQFTQVCETLHKLKASKTLLWMHKCKNSSLGIFQALSIAYSWLDDEITLSNEQIHYFDNLLAEAELDLAKRKYEETLAKVTKLKQKGKNV